MTPKRADAVLINAVAAFLVDPFAFAEERDGDIAAIAEALPKVTRDDHRLARLAELAERLVATWPRRRSEEWSRAHAAAGSVVADVLRWRVAELNAQDERRRA